MDDASVERVRSFNRTVGRTIGALEDRFLGRDRPMGEARVLWEVRDGLDVAELRRRLGLDAGYLSRLLRSLQRQGLITVGAGVRDRRARRVAPTSSGSAEQLELDRRSDAVAAALLHGLETSDQARLVNAMAEVERLILRSQTVIAPAAAASADVQACFARYFAELDERFRTGFDVTRSNPADIADLTPPQGLVLLARIGEDPVGCGALLFHGDGIATLKRMWVAPLARGTGLGRRLLVALEEAAALRDVTTIHLETNLSLTEAITMYRSAGYREVAAFNDEPYADHWFEKRLVARRGGIAG
jgi:DNA-binding MarR family transcriptional regulator/GNAT superfamily N-acetyltransferase